MAWPAVPRPVVAVNTAPYRPLDVRCDPDEGGCGSPPGMRCRSLVLDGRPFLKRCHAARITRARLAETARSQPRAPMGTTDAWTCPECSRSYWPPREWESELWPPVRTAAQLLHSTRHARERVDRRQVGR